MSKYTDDDDCFVFLPVKRLADKTVFAMTYRVSSTVGVFVCVRVSQSAKIDSTLFWQLSSLTRYTFE